MRVPNALIVFKDLPVTARRWNIVPLSYQSLSLFFSVLQSVFLSVYLYSVLSVSLSLTLSLFNTSILSPHQPILFFPHSFHRVYSLFIVTRPDTRHKMRLVCVLFTFENNTGRTDQRTDGPTDGRTRLLIEMRRRI